MAYCNRCGHFVLDTDRFCPQCGASQRPESAEASGKTDAGESATPPSAPAPPGPAAGAESPVPPTREAAAPPPPAAAPPPLAASPPPAGSVQPNIAAMLCYLPGMGWIAAVIFLTLDSYRANRYVRFHAFQGLYLTALWLLARVFFFPFPSPVEIFPLSILGFRKVLQLAVIVAQILGMVKTVQNQEYRLPVLGELAEKALA